jgi:hypothetical protein
LIVRKVKDGEHLLPGDGWIELEELIDRLTTLQKIDQTLDGNPCTSEAGRTTHSLGVHPDDFVELALLFRGHNLTLEQLGGWRNKQRHASVARFQP